MGYGTPDTAKRLLERFQLARVPSLPQLFLQMPFLAANESVGPQELVASLRQDAVLHLKLLSHAPERSARPPQRQGALTPAEAESLVLNAALQSASAELDAPRVEFHKRQWCRSQLCSLLLGELAIASGYPRVEEARFCGLMLNVGELVLENVFGELYLDLQWKAASEAELLLQEEMHFHAQHAALGAALLESLQVDGAICDALRYHHEPREWLRDASRLVKLAWLCSLLAEATNPAELQGLAEACALVGLEASAAVACSERARAALTAHCARLQLQPGALGLPLRFDPWPEAGAGDAAALADLRRLMHGHNLFAATRWSGRDDLEASLAFNLRQLFGLRRFSLFLFEPDGRRLVAELSQPRFDDAGALSLSSEGPREDFGPRSVVQRSFVDGERKFLSAESAWQGLPVVDRQLLSLHGKANLCCDPLFADGRPLGVLVLPFDGAELDQYRSQSLVAALLRRRLAGLLQEAPAGTPSASPSAAQLREVVHEVNNPLGIIKNYLYLLGRRQEWDATVPDQLAVIKGEIDRIGRIIARLRDGGVSEERGPLDPNAVLESLLLVLRVTLFAEKGIQLQLELDPAMPRLHSSEGLLKQILSNLLLNAVEALPAGGRLTLRSRARVFHEGEAYAELEVQDEGPGIPSPVLERLFTYANTTKGPGHAGDGLAIVRSLSRKLGAQLSCRSGPAGTSFSLLLPLDQQEVLLT